MLGNFASTRSLIALLFVLFSGSLVSAQTMVIPFTDRGFYTEFGAAYPGNPNYAVGDSRYPGCDGNCVGDARNFFVFDLSGVTLPIASANLELTMPGPSPSGYNSPDPSENFELHDVVTSIATLMARTGGVTAAADLGSGVVYGSRTMTEADNGTVVEITLNSSAIAAMNSTHGLFGIGGSVTTLDDLPNFEYLFGVSGHTFDLSQLRLKLVPEPSSLVLLGIGAISLLGYRKAKSHN